MINLDTSLINDIGLSDLSNESKNALLEIFVQAVDLRVGQIVDERLSDSQTLEMMEIIKTEDQTKLSQWLKVNLPDYEEITQKQVELLKEEYKKEPELLKSALKA